MGGSIAACRPCGSDGADGCWPQRGSQRANSAAAAAAAEADPASAGPISAPSRFWFSSAATASESKTVSTDEGGTGFSIQFRNDTDFLCRAEVTHRSWGKRSIMYSCEVPPHGTGGAFRPRQVSYSYNACFRTPQDDVIDEIDCVSCECGDVVVKLRGAGPKGSGPPMGSLEYPRSSVRKNS
eukprot:gnl/TRDRNA2_/TRDRNA2_186752_c0_seq1.p1 gnl/TRDRNA2_/TRDRNA2_186752_c0~~gnl/TRDRNA2_/TRDRNA2_186752_c0_seq1.p1  ORF type:complete len:182 (+),score=11.90 gnl/TRDRNA2_/TRDRNA2_186752_c0_seq1:36-581(+)